MFVAPGTLPSLPYRLARAPAESVMSIVYSFEVKHLPSDVDERRAQAPQNGTGRGQAWRRTSGGGRLVKRPSDALAPRRRHQDRRGTGTAGRPAILEGAR